ncbi:MAG: DUF2214 family protein [Synechococcus sp. SB0665_bin_28]|nr:DUF2214 family protein [Synechococcus sp. SB0665_bin_28]MYF19838.1 DUF2214 family protein [Synechococcus sp. SB0677_bin_5]
MGPFPTCRPPGKEVFVTPSQPRAPGREPLRKGELPQVSGALCTRLAWSINVEVAGFASIPLLAALMAHGVGLGG